MQQSLSSRVKNRMSMMNEWHAHGSSTVQILNPFETPKLQMIFSLQNLNLMELNQRAIVFKN
jgi:hypothetical protein